MCFYKSIILLFLEFIIYYEVYGKLDLVNIFYELRLFDILIIITLSSINY